MSKLTGVTMIRNGVMFDYCYHATIQCLLDLCDEVIIVLPEGHDGTDIDIQMSYWPKEKVKIIAPETEWDSIEGKYKLSYFSNIGLAEVQEGWVIYLQADEVIHERSFPWIRQAINDGGNGYMVARHNLWATPGHILDVSHDRMPCSPYVMRLGRAGVMTYDDAESLGIDNVDTRYMDKIEIFHYGFIRDWRVMKSKVINMQVGVFGMAEYDKRLDTSEVFNPLAFFEPKDLKKHGMTHPKYINEWLEKHKGEYELYNNI